MSTELALTATDAELAESVPAPAEPVLLKQPLLWSDALEPHNLQTLPIRFSARWTEYWRIWIVNLALSILTLGIYSAWAKVRTKQYFYGHVQLGGSAFAYHGQPLPILKGRLIAAALVIIWLVCTQIGPGWMGGAALLFVLLLPWLVVRAAAFRAWNSSWRGLRFSFGGKTGGAFVRYALPVFAVVGLILALVYFYASGSEGELPPGAAILLMLLVLGGYLGYPHLVAAQKRFIVSQHRFGTTQFEFTGEGYTLFKAYFGTMFLFIPLNFVGAFLDPLTEGATKLVLPWLQTQDWVWFKDFAWPLPLILAPVLLLTSLPMLFGLGYLRGRSMHWQWNATRVGPLQFRCGLDPWEMAGHYALNGLVLALSLGLLAPWAMVRTARLRAESLSVQTTTGLDEFVGGQSAAAGATGDEVGDIVGLDVGI